jgi:UDP-3-O-[3-hydroxymyristoyl] glucosamine N-acyltransferase
MAIQISAEQIAQLVQGTVQGNNQATVSNIAKIEEAKAGDLAFLANPKYEDYLYTTKASIVLINNNLELKQAVGATLIKVADAYAAFASLLQYYQKITQKKPQGIEQPSFISQGVVVPSSAYIGAFSYIGKNVIIGENTCIYPQTYIGDNVSIGSNSTILPGAKIYNDCKVGNQVIIHAGVVIGSDGFGFAPQADGSFNKVPQLGNVVIEDNVEIGAGTTIDRATMGSTLIRKGAKLDNLIQIAHNVEIGESTVIAAQTGVSGSTKIGKQVMIGGQAGIVGHITIADGTKINAQSGVSKSVKKAGVALTGSPAADYTQMLRAQAVFKNLPQLEKDLLELKTKVNGN